MSMPHLLLYAIFAVSVASNLALFGVERRTRHRWARCAVRAATHGDPYRVQTELVYEAGTIPAPILAAALTEILVGSVSIPSILWAWIALPFDGITLVFGPALCATGAASCAGFLLVARHASALPLSQLTSLLAQGTSVILLALACLHLLASGGGWIDPSAHAYVWLALSLPMGMTTQAMVLRHAVRR
jgi:hypothetical protein